MSGLMIANYIGSAFAVGLLGFFLVRAFWHLRTPDDAKKNPDGVKDKLPPPVTKPINWKTWGYLVAVIVAVVVTISGVWWYPRVGPVVTGHLETAQGAVQGWSPLDTWTRYNVIIIYLGGILMGVADAMYKKNVGSGIVTALIGIVTAFIITSPYEVARIGGVITSHPMIANLYGQSGWGWWIVAIITLVVVIIIGDRFLIWFFRNQELGTGRPRYILYVVMVVALFRVLFGFGM